MALKSSIRETSENTRALIILLLCFIYLFTISLLSEGLYGDTDSITHYLNARYAFKYPELLVDHWGKPLFTTLAAPFAQFGLQGVIFFNIVCGLLTAWFIYRIARELNYRYALAAIPFSLFAPVYMINLFTSLTEILFGLVLVAGIYFFLRQKSMLSAIIISFIPFVRTEGLMFPAIFLIAFLVVRKYKAIPFLLTGFIIYSIAGYFHYKEFFWFFTAMPYSAKGSEIYGSGSFWYYFERLHNLMGNPLTILAIIGLVYLALRIYKDRKQVRSFEWITQYYLITAVFFIFILVHSFLWWQGMMGVLASKRFMACIMPLGGFLALTGLTFILEGLGKMSRLKKILLFIITVLVIYMPYHHHQIPAELVRENQVMKETADALKKQGIKEERIIYFDPKLPFYMGADPFIEDGMSKLFPDTDSPDLGLSDGMVIVWDTHFGEFERNLTLMDLLTNPTLKVIDAFVPSPDYNVFKGQNYMSVIFEKKAVNDIGQDWILLDSLDFERPNEKDKISFYTDTVFSSGHQSYRVNPSWKFSPSIKIDLSKFSAFEKVIIRARVAFYNPGPADPHKAELTLAVLDDKGANYRYIKLKASYFDVKPGNWIEMVLLTPVQTQIPENGAIKLYVWYYGENEIFVDDLVMDFIPVP